ncbi:hypothetical protein EDB19DRAFT_1834144, partial [Suillus lakei]
LLAEEKEEANVLADKWNNKATPPEVQANLAETKGTDMIEHVTTKMFKQAGMRVFRMSAWRDSRGKLMLGAHDHNDQFGGTNSFMKTRNWDEIFMPEWQQYAGEQFDVQDDDVPQVVTSKKRMPCKLLDLEEDGHGLPILPETMGLKRGEQQHVIRSFLTQHYRMCMGTENVKAVVPWGDLIKNQSDFFEGTYWPADIKKKKLHPTFCFKAWKDTDGDMELPAKSHQKVTRWASHHSKANAVLGEESLDEQEDHQSLSREQTPPASVCAGQNQWWDADPPPPYYWSDNTIFHHLTSTCQGTCVSK